MSYPKYYSAGNKALKRINDTAFLEVRVPKGSDVYPCSMQEFDYGDKAWMDYLVKAMTEITPDDFMAYIGRFTAGARDISNTLNNFNQAKYDGLQTKNKADLPKDK